MTTPFILAAATVLTVAHGFSTTDIDACDSDETMTVHGTIYADNYFKFWFNGEMILEDPVTFIPHQAENVTFTAPVCGTWSFAIYAADYSDDITGLEYDGNCIGDGGLKAMFSDGTVTDGDWECKTVQYGPVNATDCLFNYTALEQDYYFNPPACKYNNDSKYVGTNCTVDYYSYSSEWNTTDFDTAAHDDWLGATTYTDGFTGWGVRPSNCTEYICPAELDWSAYTPGSNATFIWGPDLNFDNRIICRYTYERETSEPTTSPSVAPTIEGDDGASGLVPTAW